MSDYLVDPNNCPTRDVKITGLVIGDNESNCALQLFANGVLCDTVSLAPLFAKEQDSVEGVDMLAWLQDTCQLQWTPQEGGTTTWNIADDIKNKLPIDLAFDPDTCTLKFTNLMGSCQTWNLIDALRAKIPTYRTAYDSDTHTLDFLCGNNTIESHVLNCGRFNFDPATCLLSYTNAKKQTQGFFIPQDQFAYDQASCTLTILPAKAGQAPVIIPTGATVNDVQFGTTPNCDGCSLRFTYKSKTVDVALPDMLVGCSFDVATNTLRMIHCSGMETNKVLPKATLQCNTLPDGTQVLVFDNGCPGGQKIFNIPGITLDTDNLTVVGSTLTFTYGGDGNSNTVIVDVCDLVAQNCNATFTAINPDGSWTFVDNAGNAFQYPAPKNCCTYLGNNPQILTGTDPTDPAGNYANKTDGDTAIECHPNGISFWRCVDGAWDLGFTKTFANNLNYFASVDGDINLAAPPALPPADPRYATKTDGDTVTVCHNNGLCAYTCVSGTWSLDWCKTFDTAPPEVFIGSATPDKAEGFTVWFDPATCVVKFCDGADGWREPRNVVCQEATPPVAKGGADLWYKPSTCSFSILCEGVWIGVNGTSEAGGGGVALTNCAGEALVDGDRVVTPDDVVCEEGCVTICGKEFAIARDRGFTIWNAANAVGFGNGEPVAVDDVIESPVCGSFTTPDCLAAGAAVTLSVVSEFNSRDHTAGLIALQNQVSIDGGTTWVTVGLGGFVLGPPNLNNQTDNENGGVVTIPLDPGTTYDVKTRVRLAIAGATFDGYVPLNQIETDWFYDYISCDVARA